MDGQAESSKTSTQRLPPKFSLANTLLEGFVSLEFPISLVWSPFVFPSKGSRRKSHHVGVAETIFPRNDNLLSRRFRNFPVAAHVSRYVGMARFRGPRTPEVVVLITLGHRQASVKSGGNRVLRWDGMSVLKDESGIISRFERGLQRGEGDGRRLEILAGGRDIVDIIVASIMILSYKNWSMRPLMILGVEECK